MNHMLAPGLQLRGRMPIFRRNRFVQRSFVNDVVITSTAAVASASYVLSSLQLFNAVAHLPEGSDQRIGSGDDDDAFVWSVATVLSLIPIFNFTAWAMAAQSTDASRRFYTLSALYAPAAVMPLLTGSLPLSSVLLYALCVLHVQVELTAAINPEAAAKVLAALPGKGRLLVAAGDRGARTLSAFMEALEYTIQKELDPTDPKLPLREQRMFEEDMQTQKELQKLEKGDWDDKLLDRSKRDEDTQTQKELRKLEKGEGDDKLLDKIKRGEDMQTRKELQKLEKGDWDDKLLDRSKRDEDIQTQKELQKLEKGEGDDNLLVDIKNGEDMQTRKELQKLEKGDWDDKLLDRSKRDADIQTQKELLKLEKGEGDDRLLDTGKSDKR